MAEKKESFILKSFKSDYSVKDQELIKTVVEKSKVIVLDIEGTITAIDFVQKELFPYARAHMEDYIMKNYKDTEVQKAFAEIKKQASIDEQSNLEGFVPIIDGSSYPEDSDEFKNYLKSIIANLKWQMDNDRKTTGLKKIQGFIWKIGYENNNISGHLYDDVIPALELWKSKGKEIYIYSSGSVEAQKNLLKYSKFGDLTGYFSQYFDTTIGSKVERDSYKKISSQMNQKPDEIVFFTDRIKELWAAFHSDFKTILVVRDPEDPFLLECPHLIGIEDGQIASFADLLD